MMYEQISQFGNFHDAGVSQLHLENGILNIKLDIFNDEKQDYDTVTLVFGNVKDPKVGGEKTSTFEAVYDDGEILDFHVSNRDAKILIQWNDFKNKTNCTKSYSFTFESIDINDERNPEPCSP